MNQSDDLSSSRRNQIHQAALVCFGQKGYHQATMDDIVAESGLSKGTLYWYFPSKKDLFISLLDDGMQRFGSDWRVMLETPDLGAIQKLRTSLSFFKTEIVRMSPLADILLEAWALIRHDEDVEARLREFYIPYVDLMAEIIEDGIAEGVFFVDSSHDVAVVIVTLLDGIMLAISTGLELGDWDQILDTAEEMILTFLGVDGGLVD
jgi:AcrR family transcriptional regulator